ncbi:MAG: ABC transporter permease [Bacteroidetes bacterium]|nr:ABC transporter permease [Bacteroidota bacterium]
MKLVVLLKLIGESFRFAWNSLKMNVFRTVLSLLGVTVGIFAIIAVLTVVDSLERSIKQSLDFLGTSVIYVQKWDWVPENEGEYEWWRYWKRPNASYKEFKFLEANLKNASAVAIIGRSGNVLVKRENNSYNQTTLRGGSYYYNEVFSSPIEKGRYFSVEETEIGRNVAIIGFNIVKNIFPDTDPLGKEVSIKGLKFAVIGVMEEEGESFLSTPSNDDNIVIPYVALRKIVNTGTGAWNENGSTIGIKGLESDIGLVELEYEIIGLMRSHRGLKPKEEANFAINRPEAIMDIISGVFDVIGMAGWVIGGFSILVGGFGIANIMFVSVRERTPIIGIQKSLGAKNYFILFQFLFESIFLSLIGGLVGLGIVYLLSFISLGTLDLVLTFKNVLLGAGVSSLIGIASGIIPAVMAARMDPVIAIRSTG